MKNTKHTLESCKETANKYTTVKDFRTKENPTYKACVRNNWLDEVCGHMEKATGRQLTDEQLLEEVSKYDNMGRLQINDSSLYNMLRRRNLVNRAKENMNCRIQHTEEGIRQEALKYDSRSEFERKALAYYKAANRRGIMDSVCEHMDGLHTYHTKESLAEEAKKYNSKADFQHKNVNSYTAAKRRGILDEICQHMTGGRPSYTFEEIHKEALKYKHRQNFKDGHSQYYSWAYKKGFLDKVCSHMEPILCNRFTESGWAEHYPDGSYLYLVKIGEDYCKVGITGKGAQKRAKEFPYKVKVLEEFFFDDSRTPFRLEKQFLKLLRANFEICKENDWSGCNETFIIKDEEEFLRLFHDNIDVSTAKNPA